MLKPLKKATRKRKTNTVAAGSVAHGFNGLRLELELDRAEEGAGYGELATVQYFASLSAINFAVHICDICMCAAHRSNMS